MPCYHRVRKKGNKERNCGKKDVVAYKLEVEKYDSRGTWVKIVSFCEEHEHGMDRPSAYSRDVVNVYRPVVAVDSISVEDFKTLKNLEAFSDVKSNLKRLFKHKKNRKLGDSDWVALLQEAWEEFIVESVNNA